MNPQLRALWVPLTVAMLLLAACGKDLDAAAAGGQVAATVNGKSIVFRQIADPTHAGDTGQPPEPPSQEAIETLDRLIDQELLAQRAQEMNLDKDPTVMLEMEAVRHHILAQAYINRGMRVVEATPEEISRYYQDHPGLFEQRRIYYFQELITHVGREHLEVFRRLASSGKLEDIAGWLSENGLPFQRVISIKTAEQLPSGLLPRLAMMQNAQVTIFEANDTLNIVQLMLAQPAPLSLSEATPAIEKMLLSEKRQAFMRDKASQLREKADIRYLGPFAREPDAASPAAPTAPAVPVPPAKDVTHVNKGMSSIL